MMADRTQQLHEQNLRDLKLIREDPAWALSMVQRVRELEAALESERELREQIEDDHWPYEWQVATAEREKRKLAEQRCQQLADALTVRETKLRGVVKMARYGTGPDTPPEVVLETIVHYVEKALASLPAATQEEETWSSPTQS